MIKCSVRERGQNCVNDISMQFTAKIRVLHCVSNRLQSQRHTEQASVKSGKRIIYDSNIMI